MAVPTPVQAVASIIDSDCPAAASRLAILPHRPEPDRGETKWSRERRRAAAPGDAGRPKALGRNRHLARSRRSAYLTSAVALVGHRASLRSTTVRHYHPSPPPLVEVQCRDHAPRSVYLSLVFASSDSNRAAPASSAGRLQHYQSSCGSLPLVPHPQVAVDEYA